MRSSGSNLLGLYTLVLKSIYLFGLPSCCWCSSLIFAKPLSPGDPFPLPFEHNFPFELRYGGDHVQDSPALRGGGDGTCSIGLQA